MPVTVTTTCGSASANSYATVAEGDTFFATRPYSTDWTSLADADAKAPFLLEAAKVMQGFNWLGSRVDDTQKLAWPRVNVLKRDGAGYGWGPGYLSSVYASDSIPQVIKDIQCEIALNIIRAGDTGVLSGNNANDNIKSFKIGDISVEGDGATTYQSLLWTARVTALCQGLLTQAQRVRG